MQYPGVVYNAELGSFGCNYSSTSGSKPLAFGPSYDEWRPTSNNCKQPPTSKNVGTNTSDGSQNLESVSADAFPA